MYVVLACSCLVALLYGRGALAANSLDAREVARRGTISWLADDQVYRAGDQQEFVDASNVLTGDVVRITLLTRRAVVVTFSADMFAGTNLAVGLKVNSRECAFYGPAAMSSEETNNHTSTLRWVVSKDEVSLGTNRFEVCVVAGTGSYDLRTLTVERPY
jgi:hypothetical protein